ncbi:tetraacyldisaccharide 4'-kinase [Pseudooceanicola sp. LIPI14-2-Ac024]|uniref:tetraacyldisaccharide 4'-kinase n=1 Tax=Pseudooceanicola sp. LIPI14-2-Ac024 TaxID=3344875 RepID=UPI0035D003FA
MRAPGFWHRPPGIASTLLAPLGAVYGMATRRRLAGQAGFDPGVPVICVGNINAGGTGKTPTVIALLQRLADRGVAAHVLSRGHGGSLEGPLRVDERQHRADEVGDEPLLMAAFGPVWVGRDRVATAQAAVAAGAGVLLLDDGFQNPALKKDLSIVVVDAVIGFGNGRCIPAGPLREPVAAGMARADMVLSVGQPRAQSAFHDRWGAQVTVPHLTASLEPLQMGMDWHGTPYLAFAGIGHPGKFFSTLKSLGADLVQTVALSDHQPLTPAIMARLERDAAQHGAQIVTTEKDAVRLPPDWRGRVLTLPVRMRFDDEAALDAALAGVMGHDTA